MKNRKNNVLPFPELLRTCDLFPARLTSISGYHQPHEIEHHRNIQVRHAHDNLCTVESHFVAMAERPMTVYVKSGNIDVENEVGVEIVDPLPVEVQNVVDVSVQ
jgi:hypothetical protein